MAKGQIRSTREKKKPKQNKTKPAATPASPFAAGKPAPQPAKKK